MPTVQSDPQSPAAAPARRPLSAALVLVALVLVALALVVLPVAVPPAAAQGHEPHGEAAPPGHVDQPKEHPVHRDHPGERKGQMREGGRCVSDCDCPPGELCSPDSASCEPAICPRIYQPVCGLDGRTYGNRCEADAAHVVVAHPGECARTCGGIAGEACPEGQICDMPAGMCDGRDLQGECKERPEVCTEEFDPVCGCDGTTYSNDCKRLQAGAQKAYDGRCRGDDREPPTCTRNEDCARVAYCHHPVGRCEGTGRCEARPDACVQVFMPVCGCDGRTYSNGCEAAAAGVSVAHDGRCG